VAYADLENCHLYGNRACHLADVASGLRLMLFSPCRRYFWSLDTFTDFTWQDLTKLSIILVVLLVVEVRV
jgi:hypothetical protein